MGGVVYSKMFREFFMDYLTESLQVKPQKKMHWESLFYSSMKMRS